jgi:hypothetical protein
MKYFDHGSPKQAAAILLTGILLAGYTYLADPVEYLKPATPVESYPLGASPATWGALVAFIICGGSALYALFDGWLGRYSLYRWLRWFALSFWTAVGITVLIRMYISIKAGTVVPDWSL